MADPRTPTNEQARETTLKAQSFVPPMSPAQPDPAQPEMKPPLERKNETPRPVAQNAGRADVGRPGPEGNATKIGSPEYFLQALAGDGSSMRVWQMMDAPGRFVLVKRNHGDVSGVGLIELEEGMMREEADERLRRAFDGSAVLV